ncbi:DUF4956 domain-containing protein [Candidatus Saccharibacteria bacterium]|nr:DUF4956 domain-containing protein [Candidatus Saccharibacteria bacterium]
MFNTIITDTITPSSFFICLGVAFILGLIVALVHQFTAKRSYGRSASAGMVTTLAILPMLVSVAIMLVNGNLGAGVAVMGIFSLVRFRSIPGNSRSILSVFFAMAIGLAVGTGYIAFAGIFTIAVSLMLIILAALSFGESAAREKRLTILVPEDIDYTNVFDDIFLAYTRSNMLEKAKTTNMGSLFELVYRVELKDGINEKEFIDKIRVKNGNLKVALSHMLLEEEL